MTRCLQLDIEAERTHFLHEHVEAFRNAGFEGVVTTDDSFVDLGASSNVVRLHRQHFLQCVGGAVSFQGPDFHFAETLTAELRLATQRLLGNERVWTNRTCMDLVVDQVVQLQHVNVADGDRAVELFARLAIVQLDLAGRCEASISQHLGDVFFARTVKHRCRNRNALAQMLCIFHHLVVRKASISLLLPINSDHAVTQWLDLLTVAVSFQHLADFLAHACAGPAKMGFQNLPNVHARRHTKRVQHDIYRLAILQIWHVFLRNNTRDDTLVAVTAGHLVARLNLALHSDKDLDHFHDAWRQFITTLKLFDLVHEAGFEALLGVVILHLHGFEFGHGLFVCQGNVPPLRTRHVIKLFRLDLAFHLVALRTCCATLPDRKSLRRP